MKSRVIRRGGGKQHQQLEWKLRFRALPGGSDGLGWDGGFQWQPDGWHPLQLFWSNQRNSSALQRKNEKKVEQESRLRLIVDNHIDPAAGIDISADLYYINTTPLSQLGNWIQSNRLERIDLLIDECGNGGMI